MKVVLASRFPLIDLLPWKRRIATELLDRGADLLVLHSQSSPHAQLRYALETVRERGGAGAGGSGGPGLTGAVPRRSPRASLHRWARRNGVQTYTTRRLNDDGCLRAVAGFGADAMLLLGADIAPAALLERIDGPTLNPHFGLLPEYRGMNVTEWAIFNDDPVGLSVHRVDAGIDTGPIVERVRIPVHGGDDLDSIRERQRKTAGDLLLAAIDALREGALAADPQDPAAGRQYYRMHPRLRARVIRKLRRGEYGGAGEDPRPDRGHPERLSLPV